LSLQKSYKVESHIYSYRMEDRSIHLTRIYSMSHAEWDRGVTFRTGPTHTYKDSYINVHMKPGVGSLTKYCRDSVKNRAN